MTLITSLNIFPEYFLSPFLYFCLQSAILGQFRTNGPVRDCIGGVLPSYQKLVADWEQRHAGLYIRSQAAVCFGDTATGRGHGWFVTDVKHRAYLVAGYLAAFMYDSSI